MPADPAETIAAPAPDDQPDARIEQLLQSGLADLQNARATGNGTLQSLRNRMRVLSRTAPRGPAQRLLQPLAGGRQRAGPNPCAAHPQRPIPTRPPTIALPARRCRTGIDPARAAGLGQLAECRPSCDWQGLPPGHAPDQLQRGYMLRGKRIRARSELQCRTLPPQNLKSRPCPRQPLHQRR